MKNVRLVPRLPGDTLGPLRLTTRSSDTFTADVHDISILGAGLIGDCEYPAGSSFVVEAGPRGKKLADVLSAELRHATQRADGRWLLGCSFSRPLTTGDVEVLG
jgi:hypothetical protein